MFGLLLSRRRLIAVLFLLVLAVFGVGWWLFSDLPSPDALIVRASPDTTKIYDRNGKLLYEILDPRAGRRTRVALTDLPPALVNAVVSVEDANFYSHPGVDAVGIARAVVQFVRERGIVSGGSTITQQLARLVLLSPDEQQARTVTRKLREAALALQLSQSYSKDQILELYLNEVYFGNLAYGVQAAAQTYFGKPARDLDLAESALLAGMIQSPAAYDPYLFSDAARARQRIVLDLMVKRGDLTSDQADLAAAETLHVRATDQREFLRAPHFVAFVRNQLEQRYGAEMVNAGGLSVTTTLDLDLQQRAEETVTRHLRDLTERTQNESAPAFNLNDAAAVGLVPASGEILIMVGSADYFDASIDGAVNVALAARQPGSSIKPITYAAAFSRGDYTPATVLSDVPTTFTTREGEPYAPQNYDRAWHGPVSLRTALATSSNLIAVKVLDHVGLDAMIGMAQSLGITTLNEPERFGHALTLGGGEVRLLELTAAYAAFANQGMRVQPRAILHIMQASTALTVSEPPAPVQAVTPQVAYLVNSILSDNLARIPAFGENSVLAIGRPAAAKTGTTTDFRDNWTLGYTPDLAVGVWAGNADNSPMYRVTGITGAGPIWHDVMQEALRNTPPRGFERPDGLVEREICESSGLLATADCARVRREIFIEGTQPSLPDNSYQAFTLDAATGFGWAEGCRGPKIQRVLRVYPPDARAWAIAKQLPQPPTLDCRGQPLVTAIASKTIALNNHMPPLDIVSPALNSVYELSPQLPPDLQQIEISARLNQNLTLARVQLYIDRQPVGEFTQPPYRVLWQLQPGAHRVHAIALTPDGNQITSPIVTFAVR